MSEPTLVAFLENKRIAPHNAILSAKAATFVGLILFITGLGIVLDDDASLVPDERLEGFSVVVTLCAPTAPIFGNGDDDANIVLKERFEEVPVVVTL